MPGRAQRHNDVLFHHWDIVLQELAFARHLENRGLPGHQDGMSRPERSARAVGYGVPWISPYTAPAHCRAMAVPRAPE